LRMIQVPIKETIKFRVLNAKERVLQEY